MTASTKFTILSMVPPRRRRRPAQRSTIRARMQRRRDRSDPAATSKLSAGSRRCRADADRTAHAGAAEAAIAERILGEILLVVVLGVIERRRVEDFGGDGIMALGLD